jgi:hypothetical protein
MRKLNPATFGMIIVASIAAPAITQACDFACRQERAQRQWDRDREREAQHQRELRAAQERENAWRREAAREEQRRINEMKSYDRQYERDNRNRR